MPGKKMKNAKSNQGNQWGNTGSAGNIKHLPKAGGTDKTKKSRVSSKHGRDKSIGR